MSVCDYVTRDGWKCPVRPRDGSNRCAKHRSKSKPLAVLEPISSKRVLSIPVEITTNALDDSSDDELRSLKSCTSDDDSGSDNYSRLSCNDADDELDGIDEFGNIVEEVK